MRMRAIRLPLRLPLQLVLGAAAAAGALACDAGWLALNHVPSFRELDARQAHAVAEQPGAHLIQAGRAGPGGALLGAAYVDPEGPWPEDAASGGPVVIVAARPEAGYRLAARMARSGIQDVVVVSGGLSAWRDPGAPGTGPGEPEVAAAARRELHD